MRMPRCALPLSVFFCGETAHFRFLKVKRVKIFFCYDSFPFVRTKPFQIYLGWNYIDAWCNMLPHWQHKRVAKRCFCLLRMYLALLFLKFRFSVVKKCTQLSKCLNRFQLTSLSSNISMWVENVPSLLEWGVAETTTLTADLIMVVAILLHPCPWCLSAFGRSLATRRYLLLATSLGESALACPCHILTLFLRPPIANARASYLLEVIHTSSDLNTWAVFSWLDLASPKTL
jgi:hypothetical protein